MIYHDHKADQLHLWTVSQEKNYWMTSSLSTSYEERIIVVVCNSMWTDPSASCGDFSYFKATGWLPHYQEANKKEGCIVVYNSIKLEIMIKKKKKKS